LITNDALDRIRDGVFKQAAENNESASEAEAS